VRAEKVTTTVGWTSCDCADYRPGIVLDPFAGSGTTLLEALRAGRRAIGIELNPEYAQLAERRCSTWWRKPVRTRAMPDAQLTLDPPEA
jgi:tRNA G10  N-methylase Trm11